MKPHRRPAPSAAAVAAGPFAALFTAASSQSLANTTSADFVMGAFDFTICCWVWLNTLANPQGGLLSIWNVGSTAQRPFGFFLNGVGGAGTNANPRLQCYQSDGTFTRTSSTDVVSTGAWHFIAGWYNHSDKKARVQLDNGTVFTAPTALTTFPSAIGPSTIPLRMGGLTSAGVISQGLDGILDSVGVWKSTVGNGGVLTGSQLTSIYNAGAGKNFSQLTAGEKVALISWWDLEEATGVSKSDAIGTTTLADDTNGPTRTTGLV